MGLKVYRGVRSTGPALTLLDGGSRPLWANRHKRQKPGGINMKQAVEVEEMAEIEDVPVSPLVMVKQSNRYGSVEGLDDEELADPAELERQVWQSEWAPILALPEKARRDWIQPAIDESGHIDWGAFGSVDFDRIRPEFDKARYKAQKLREQMKDLAILIGIVKERLPGRAKYLVLKYARMGIIELEHIVNEDMLALARMYLRARRLQAEIATLQEAGRGRRQSKAEAWLRLP